MNMGNLRPTKKKGSAKFKNTEIDILEIDESVKKFLSEEQNKIPEYEKILSELERTLENLEKSEKETEKIRKNIKKEISKLKKEINRIFNGKKLYFYILRTSEIIVEYREILEIPMKVSFHGKQEVDDNTNRKKELIQKYIEIASRYKQLDIETESAEQVIKCENCGKKEFIIEDSTYICVECSVEQNIPKYTTSFRDIDRVNITGKYTYDRKVHFKDCINQYQGKQNCNIPQKIYDQLEKKFIDNNLLKGDENSSRNVRYSKITKEHILLFLRELGYPKHYENVTLLHYNITGKQPDDISHLEEALLGDFDILVTTYDRKIRKTVPRVNFISAPYVLFQLLKKHGHKCNKEDFVILKTTDRQSFHDEICEKLFSLLGWVHTPLF